MAKRELAHAEHWYYVLKLVKERQPKGKGLVPLSRMLHLSLAQLRRKLPKESL